MSQQHQHDQFQPPPNPYPQSSLLPPLPQPPPPKKRKPTVFFVVIIVALFVVLGAVGALTAPAPSSQSSNDASTAQATPPTDTPTDTPTDIPTMSAQDYKALTTDTTVATLDKDGNADQGKDVHFTCEILDFVKDSNGNTAGANVDDPNTSGVLQVIFPASTDLSQLNTNDTLEVWGSDDGTSSGQNAYGATIQEVGVTAVSMTDHTTRYSTP
jgi:hypothetical protein